MFKDLSIAMIPFKEDDHRLGELCLVDTKQPRSFGFSTGRVRHVGLSLCVIQPFTSQKGRSSRSIDRKRLDR